MASNLKTVTFIADQSSLGERLTFKRMFGEYALYLDKKVVAFICNDSLYLKPTDAGRALLGAPNEAPPYPGAKNYFLLEQELEDTSLLRKALEITAFVLPLPKPKPPSKRKAAKTSAQRRGAKSEA